MGIVNAPDDDDDGNAILLEMIRTMRDVFGNWKIEQIEHAFNLGLEGVINVNMELYNKPFNLVFLSQLMKAYKEFISPIIEKEKRIEPPQKTPSQQQQKKIIIRNVKREFELYKKTKRINNLGNSIYQVLKGKINVEESELRPVAEEIYRSEQEAKKTKAQTERTFTGTIKESLIRIENYNYNCNDGKRINRIICDLKLKSFFRQVLEMKMDIADIIDN
ncbi:MAG: hypothetical protein DRJ05_05380 [Bacteroidetes bacterium]|nr:MAG: hypothetical protein DRJ05_05380 [Bacteroidota bacterium]